MFEAAKQIIPPGSRMLIVGDEKTSPCHVPYLASGVHNNSIIVQWSRDAQTEADLVKRFEDNHISHVMLNVAETTRLSGYKILNWDDRSLALYCSFFEKHLRLVKETQIVEKFYKHSSPLLLYVFSAQPLDHGTFGKYSTGAVRRFPHFAQGSHVCSKAHRDPAKYR